MIDNNNEKRVRMITTTFPTVCPPDITREVETLRLRHENISKNVGKFVLISGDDKINYFNTYRDAVNQGYQKYGLGNFLVRNIKERDPIRIMRWGIKRLGNKLHLAKNRAE
jgi:hypothetical protein